MPRPLTARAQAFIAPALADGAVALDATTGTGADTAFLASAVGPFGRVHAFDIQPAALTRARRRLADAALGGRVRWHRASHDRVDAHLGEEQLAAAMFNLGWLPGSDSGVTTRPGTTVAALDMVAHRLARGGRLSILAYRGHAGGAAEAAAVAAWVRSGDHGLECHEHVASGSESRPGPVLYGLLGVNHYAA